MGNKKKGPQKQESLKQSPPPLNPDEDPYWKVSTENLDPRKGAHFIERFLNYQVRYPQWVEDISSGVPTYYAVLGLLKGFSKEELQSAYEQECKFSAYPDDSIEEAYRVLSDLQLRVKYDEFLIRFEHATRYNPAHMTEGLKKAHDEFLKNALIIRKLGDFAQKHHDYMYLITKGMPSIFEYSGLKHGCSDGDIDKYASSGDELTVFISSIMRDPKKREQFANYDTLIETSSNEDAKKQMRKLQKRWKELDPRLVRKILQMSLQESEQMMDIFERTSNTLSLNHDWKEFLPPSEKTFFSIFGIDEHISSLPKSEIESLLRARYRTMERTPDVNLAYTVLKNPTLRDEYIWMSHHYELKQIYDFITEEEKYPDELNDARIQELIAEKMREFEKIFGRIR
ncbi:MAG: hypothetical protein GX268_05120 [Methanomicrobiales archaeon]|nr:hypothetical protein [Methanomicrobiales archaeon]